MTSYYLFSSTSCPFAHRCEIAIKLLNLDMTIIHCDPIFTFANGWKIEDNSIVPYKTIKEMYSACNYSSKYHSLPILYDGNQIICNESRDIIEMLSNMKPGIISIANNEKLYTEFYDNIVVGTYKAGHVKTLEEYEHCITMIYIYLESLNFCLEGKKYVVDDTLSGLDIILYYHLIRFDTIFYDLFKVNKLRLSDYKHITTYLNSLSSHPAFQSATDLQQIKECTYLCENNLHHNLGYIKCLT